MSTDKITFLTNWYAGRRCGIPHLHFLLILLSLTCLPNGTAGLGGLAIPILTTARRATPYHAPLFLAQAKGYFKDEGIQVAILEPNDPSVSAAVWWARL